MVLAGQMDLQPVFDHSISPHPTHLEGCQWKEHRKGGGVVNASPELAYFAVFTVSPLSQKKLLIICRLKTNVPWY